MTQNFSNSNQNISDQVIEKIGKLARIKLEPEEKSSFASQISQVINWVSQLNEVDTSSIEALGNVNHSVLTPQEDIISDGNIEQEILKNAPKQFMDYFVVPKVIE